MNPTPSPGFDEGLIRSFLAGDEPSFELLVARHRQDVMAVAASILRHREDAEDVAQQVFLKVYERASSYRGEAPVGVWLRRLTVSSAIDLMRRRRVRAFLCPWVSQADNTRSSSPWTAPDEVALYGSLKERVGGILERLPARQRAIFALRVFEEWSLPEIAESLGVDTGTVKTHLHRAVHRVRRELQAVPAGARAELREQVAIP